MFGIHTALATPFASDGSVDLPTFERLVQRQLDAGIHGLVPCGTTGETPTLLEAEQRTLLATCLKLADGKVPVTVGVGTNSTRTTVASTRRAKEDGATAGLLVFPYYNKPNPAGLRAHVEEAAAVGLPLVLYHVPGRTGQHLPAPQLAELANLPGVIAVKEATGDLRYGTEVIHRTATPILSGDDFSFLGLLAQGGKGCVSVVSNVDPARTVAVYEHLAAGRVSEAQAEYLKLWPLMTWLFSDSNPVPAKAALAELGFGSSAPRAPLAAYDGPSPRPMLRALGLCD